MDMGNGRPKRYGTSGAYDGNPTRMTNYASGMPRQVPTQAGGTSGYGAQPGGIDAPMSKAFMVLVCVLILVVFYAPALLGLVGGAMRFGMPVIGIVFAVGAWLVMAAVNVPVPVGRIDVSALEGLDATTREAAEAINRVLDGCSDAIAGNVPAGIAHEAAGVLDVAHGMSSLIAMPEFSKGGADSNRSLVFSLATSWLGDTWEGVQRNTKFLAYGGRAASKARQNLSEIGRQCNAVSDTLDKIRGGLVSDATTDVMSGAEYLRQRLGDNAGDVLG